MILKEFRNIFTKKLSLVFPETEIDSFFFLLIKEKFDLQRINIALQSDFEIPPKDLPFLESITKRLQNQEPIQYILGKTEFYGLPFYVDKNTLIPRPETEELVDWIIDDEREKRAKSQKPTTNQLKILDIGTGTGCIAISLAKNLSNAKVFAIDISENALNIARQNAELNKVDITLFQTDILNTNSLDDVVSTFFDEKIETIKFDIIISNPPYVRELEKVEINNNVLENEPHLALFVDDKNPLVFYTKITELAKNSLKEEGSLYFEINQYLGKEMAKMLKQKEFNSIQLRKDLFGNDRMIKSIL